MMTAQTERDSPSNENSSNNSAIKIVATQHGGHLGFFGRRGDDPDRHWLDWRICEWNQSLASTIAQSASPEIAEICR